MGAPALAREFIAGQMPPPEPPKYSPRTRVLVLLAAIIITWSPIIAAIYFTTKGN